MGNIVGTILGKYNLLRAKQHSVLLIYEFVNCGVQWFIQITYVSVSGKAGNRTSPEL